MSICGKIDRDNDTYVALKHRIYMCAICGKKIRYHRGEDELNICVHEGDEAELTAELAGKKYVFGSNDDDVEHSDSEDDFEIGLNSIGRSV